MTTASAPRPARATDISKFMSFVLRHAPSRAGLSLDENGWTDFATLCAALHARFGVGEADIRRIVAESPKKRFTLEGERIRAAQGHSVAVELSLERREPPAHLFHGTSAVVLPAILAEGLTRQSRHHVHLSPDLETARIVARRRKGPHALLLVDAGGMAQAGHVFFLSENGVWLTDHVPPAFLQRAEDHASP